MNRTVRPFGLALVLFAFSVAAPAELLGPTPYLSEADSPLDLSGLGVTSFLETFEDGLLNTPGVSANFGAPYGPAGNADSVDGDDGAIDGHGSAGHSFFFNPGATGITFTFTTAAFGALPREVGIVWTDGSGTIGFEAFDENGVSLGGLLGTHADGSSNGTTAEDRFYGVRNAGGISRIHIGNASGGIEVDHLQYGMAPEPASMMLLACAALVLRRR